jgi:hypothetical protein
MATGLDSCGLQDVGPVLRVNLGASSPLVSMLLPNRVIARAI